MPELEKEDKLKRSIDLSKISILLMLVAGVALMVLLGLLCVTDNVEIKRSRNDSGFSRIDDYSCREIRDADAPIGVRKEYTFFLSDTLESDTHLAFYTVHQYVDVFLDGENIYSLQPSGENRISKTVGSNWVMIPLYREDAGKEICVEITPVYESFRDREVEFLTGSPLAIYTNRLSRDLPQLILGGMTVFVGIVFVCVAGYNLIKKKRGKSLAALGMFSVMMGFWRLTDTRFTPFMFPNRPILLFYVSITMLMLGIVPLIKWVEDRLNKVSRNILDDSRYLRRNIKIIEEEGLIDFSKELEQVVDYVSLEQLRFPDVITFEKEIEESNFQIPPLTIQPIIENAIKHGLVEHGRKGTVRLQTIREKNNIVITVTDDGAGFEPEECQKEDSVGIKNVRFRLESMLNGSLVIKSIPGEGTQVTIMIPAGISPKHEK